MEKLAQCQMGVSLQEKRHLDLSDIYNIESCRSFRKYLEPFTLPALLEYVIVLKPPKCTDVAAAST